MERHKIERANKLIKIIDALNSYREINHDGNHFEFVQHYGIEAKTIRIPREFNCKFMILFEEVINYYEQELENL